jgi:hypothetical protein
MQSHTMSPRERQPSATVVQITCDGGLPVAEQAEFDGWQIQARAAATVLTGHDVDQAALHGALDRLARLGLHVVEVSRRPEVQP